MTSIKTKTILTFALSVTFLSACAHTDTTSAKPDMMAKSASASDKFDVKTLTCWDVLTVSEDDIDMAMMLVYGYAQGAKGMSADIQSLSAGHNIGQPYYSLVSSRLRLFGGTAAIWGGRCAELDTIDFQQRSFLKHSGWPIDKTDLDPYYKSAFSSLGLERPGQGRLWDKIGRKKPDFDAELLDADLWCFDENGERFTDPNRGDLDSVKILLNATLSDMTVNAQGKISAVTVKRIDGLSKEIKATIFVLAAGAIETCRLLLAAVSSRPNGFGNSKDQVGRYFMEHPHARGGQVIPNNLAHALMVLPRAIRKDGKRYAAYLRPSERLQRQKGILNTSLSFAPRRHEGENAEVFRKLTGKLKHDLPSSKF